MNRPHDRAAIRTLQGEKWLIVERNGVRHAAIKISSINRVMYQRDITYGGDESGHLEQWLEWVVIDGMDVHVQHRVFDELMMQVSA